MVRVGYPQEWLPQSQFAFPSGAEIIPLQKEIPHGLELEVYVPPFPEARGAAVWRQLRGVRLVQSVMAGVEWILPWLPADVVLCDGRGVHDISTSEWVISAVLAGLKFFPAYRDFQTEKRWANRRDIAARTDAANHPLAGRSLSDELTGKTVLIVGYGAIGEAIEKRLAAFDVTILRVARHKREGVFAISEFDQLLPQSDIVILILPVTTETKGFMSATRFALMKPGSLFINAARGPVTDTAALLNALDSRRIRAVLDVTDPEPLPPTHPLWSAPNCFITPHIAGATPNYFNRALRLVADQVARYMRGEPLNNVVNRELGY